MTDISDIRWPCRELNCIHREQKIKKLLLHKTYRSLAKVCHVATALGIHNAIDLYTELKLQNRG
jgi:hypothetical protein